MAFLDDLSKKVTKLGQDVSQKTKNVTDSMKINSQINDQKKNLSKMYEDLGRMAFSKEVIRSDAQCGNMISMIEAAEKTLRDLEQQLSVAKGEVQCKNCGSFVPMENAFCPQCGAKIVAPQTQYQSQGQQAGGQSGQSSTICTNCGQPVSSDSAFCTNCGTPVQK